MIIYTIICSITIRGTRSATTTCAGGDKQFWKATAEKCLMAATIATQNGGFVATGLWLNAIQQHKRIRPGRQDECPGLCSLATKLCVFDMVIVLRIDSGAS